MSNSSKLYKKAIQISEEYLGPAGERFMRRQISVHLSIEPEELRSEHIPELVTWVRLAYALLTSNAKYVDNFMNALNALSEDASRTKTVRRNSVKNGATI